MVSDCQLRRDPGVACSRFVGCSFNRVSFTSEDIANGIEKSLLGKPQVNPKVTRNLSAANATRDTLTRRSALKVNSPH